MFIQRILLLCAVPILGALACGCDSGPRLVPVAGILTYKGKPVPNVHLDFYPESGRPSWGQTDADGRFTLEYDIDHKGAVIGKHKVYAKMGVGWEKVPGVAPSVPKDLSGFFEKYNAANSPAVVDIQLNTKELTLAWD